MDGNYLEELKKIIPKKHETCKFLWLSLIGDWKVFLIGVSQAHIWVWETLKRFKRQNGRLFQLHRGFLRV